MFSIPHPKYKFKEDFTTKLCTNYLESYANKTPCKFYEDLVFKKGDVFEAVTNTDITDPNVVVGSAKMTPFQVPLKILDKVDDSTQITDVIQGDPKVNKAIKEAENDKKEKDIKMMFILPTIVILAVVWIYGIKKL